MRVALIVIAVVVAVIAILVALLLIESRIELNKIRLTEYIYKGPKVDKALDNKSFIFLSDFHEAEEGRLNERIITFVKEAAPSLILIGGDMINGSHEEEDITPSTSLINALSEIAPIYMASGNHEMKVREGYYGYKSLWERFYGAICDKVEYIDGGKTVSLKNKREKVMSDSTAYMITDALLYAVEGYGNINGTVSGVKLAAKTGTSSIVSKKVVPNEVTNFKITGASTGNIKLAWDKTSVTGYVLERSTGNGYWTRVATIKRATVTYKNTGLSANKKYYYRIRAYKSVNGKKVYSSYSDIVNTRTAPLKTKVKVTLKDYNALKVKVTSVKGAKTYDIYRSTSKNGKYEKIIELKEAGTYKDPELVTGKTYYYKVKTCNSLDRCSGYTSPVGLKVVPKTPSIKVISTQTKKVSVTLTPVNGIDGLRIYRATSRYGKYKLIKDVKIDEDLTFNDKTKKYKYYYYKVRAYKIVDGKKVYSSYSTIKYVRSK